MLRIVMSTANCAPWNNGRPLANTSMACSSLAETVTFMSRSLACHLTVAPLPHDTHTGRVCVRVQLRVHVISRIWGTPLHGVRNNCGSSSNSKLDGDRALRNLPWAGTGTKTGLVRSEISRSPRSGTPRDTASHAATRQAHGSQGLEGGHLPRGLANLAVPRNRCGSDRLRFAVLPSTTC